MAGDDSAPKLLRIAYSEFYPFHWTDKKGELKGIFHDIITEALENRMGLSLIWTAYPWTRCQEEVKNGNEDAVMTVPTPDRRVYTETHKDPFFVKPLYLYTYAGHSQLAQIKRIKTINDIKEKGFSVVTYSGNGWHKRNIQALAIRTFESPYLANVWQMLAGKRGDLIIEWPGAAVPDITRLKLTHQVLNTGIVLSRMPFHLLIRKGHSQVNDLIRLNEIISELHKSGVVTAITEKYKY